MKPNLNFWPAGGTPFWLNERKSNLWPQTITERPELARCINSTDDDSCPHGQWRAIEDGLFAPETYSTGTWIGPQAIRLNDPISSRSLLLRARSALPQRTFRNSYGQGTVPYAFVSNNVAKLALLWNQAVELAPGDLLFRLENRFDVNVYQPVTMSRCIEYPPDSQAFGFAKWSTTIPEWDYYPYSAIPLPKEGSQVRSMVERAANGSTGQLFWLDSSELLNRTRSSLNVIAVVPNVGYLPAKYYCCSIQVRMRNATVSSGRLDPEYVTGEPSRWRAIEQYSNNVPRLDIDSSWARLLNPTLDQNNTTVFSSLIATASRWDHNAAGMGTYPGVVVEAILAAMVVNGIGRWNYNTSFLEQYLPVNNNGSSSWYDRILPNNLNFGKGGKAFDVPDFIQTQSTRLQLNVFNYGYAFTTMGKTQKAAMLVLVAYILLVVVHCVWSISTGMSSPHWGSPSEIVALAFRSRPTDAFNNTGAGIETITVYKENIRLGTRSTTKTGASDEGIELVLFLDVKQMEEEGTRNAAGDLDTSPRAGQPYR